MGKWTELFGDKLQTKEGLKPTDEVLDGKKVVGIYFSAHWCPPCRGFTPVLSTVYEEMVEQHPEFEMIFVSSDRDTHGFDEYYNEMPFQAVPFANRASKDNLGRKFNVVGIPTLIFLNADGNVITEDGRSVVANARGDIEGIWSTLTK